jgi:hypothetical protein
MALARAQEKHKSEMSGEKVIHLNLSECHKSKISEKIKRALITTRSELPSMMHYVLIYKGETTTNYLTTIPSCLMSILKEFDVIFPNELPPELTPLHGIEHCTDLIPDPPLPNCVAYRTNLDEMKEIGWKIQEHHSKDLIR